MPWHDWQFWAVTVAGVVALWVLVRQFLPRQGTAGCGSCATGSAVAAARRKEPGLVSLGSSRRK